MCTKLLYFIVSIFLLCQINAKQHYRICASRASYDACQQLARNLDVACNYYLHDVDCLLSIQSNKSVIGRITGEEALLGANLLSDNVIVLGEIRGRHPSPETAVLVKSTISEGLQGLKNKKLCHPGFKHDVLFSHLLLKELENKIIDLNQTFCSNDNYTLVEKHVNSLAQFFGQSCRPGPWTQNSNFDKLLKEKYNSLCSLCGNQKCNIDYKAPFNDSVKCLINNDADVAVTTLQEAFKFFNLSSSYRTQYKFLCKDGSFRSYLGKCTWSSQLPSLIVAERSAASSMKTYLQNNMKSRVQNILTNSGSVPDDIVEQALVDIFKLERHEKITLRNNYRNLKDYVNDQRVTIPTSETSKKCNKSFKWCTYSDLEQEKCRWLSQAAINWGIQPVVECARSEGSDELSCLDDIKKGNADIVVASSDYAYISLNKGLKSIAYPETYTTNLSVIITVKRSDNDDIKKFQDLQGKRACLPRYGGKEHLAFIDTLRSGGFISDNSNNCDYGKLLNDFIGESCVPGVRSSLIKESTEYVDKDKLCSQCRPINVTSTSEYCNDDVINKYFESDGALKCLYDKEGDFAVISKFDLENDHDFTVICKNNTVASIQGLKVDTDCALDVIPSSEVVSLADNPKNSDIILALSEYERWFGVNLQKTFHLFDRFNETLDLLFRDSTPGLSFNDENDYIKNYKKLLDNVKDCNSATIMHKISVFTFIVGLVTLLNNFL